MLHLPGRSILAIAATTLALVAAPTAAQAAPANDDFSAAAVIPAAGGTVSGDNEDSTAEPGEPNHGDSEYGEPFHSLWWSWTAPADGTTTVSTCGSAFNTRLGVYTGSSVSALSTVVSNNDSAGGACAGTAFAEASFTATAGTTYAIAVDTNGGVDASGQPDDSHPRGLVSLTLDGPDAVEPPEDPDTNPGTPGVDEPFTFTMRRFTPVCDKVDKAGDCLRKANEVLFHRLAGARKWVRTMQRRGADIILRENPKHSGTQDGIVLKELRRRGTGGEIVSQNFRPGERITTTASDPVYLKFGYFEPAEDDKLAAAALKALEKAGEGKKDIKSPCEFIATDAPPKKILTRMAQLVTSGYLTQARAGEILDSFGCGYEVSKYIEAPGSPIDFVTKVTGVDRKRHLVTLEIALPVRQDFLVVIREDPSLAATDVLGLGVDGRLATSASQPSRMTVQVVERLTGRLVAGADVSFVGESGSFVTQRTDANGETTFTSLLKNADRYAITARFERGGASMVGFRSVDVVDRGSQEFVTMSGRVMSWTGSGYAGTQEDLDRSRSLQVVPANLGTGLAGPPQAAPQISQGEGALPTADGGFVVGQHNGVVIPDDSNFVVGAAPGLLAIGGGLPSSIAARSVSPAAWANPFAGVADFLNGIVTGLQRTFAQGSGAAGEGTAAERTSAAERAAITTSAEVLAVNGAAVPASGLISDKGIGIISTGGLNIIATGGLNIISTGGLNFRDAQGNLIGHAGGNLIGQAGGNLIGHAGGNIIATGGLNMVPVYGGNLISDKGIG